MGWSYLRRSSFFLCLIQQSLGNSHKQAGWLLAVACIYIRGRALWDWHDTVLKHHRSFLHSRRHGQRQGVRHGGAHPTHLRRHAHPHQGVLQRGHEHHGLRLLSARRRRHLPAAFRLPGNQEATVTATELQTHCQDLRTWLLWDGWNDQLVLHWPEIRFSNLLIGHLQHRACGGLHLGRHVQDGDPEAQERPWHSQGLWDPPLRRRRHRAGAVRGARAQVHEPPPAPETPHERRRRACALQGAVGVGDLPHDNVRCDMVFLDSEAGTLTAGVPFQAPEHDAAVRVREHPGVRHRPRPREGLLAVEARRRHHPRLGALHGHRGGGDLVLPADLGDREEGPRVPVHVDAAEPRLHHGHLLVPAGRGRQPGKHRRQRPPRRRPVQRPVGQEQGGEASGRRDGHWRRRRRRRGEECGGRATGGRGDGGGGGGGEGGRRRRGGGQSLMDTRSPCGSCMCMRSTCWLIPSISHGQPAWRACNQCLCDHCRKQ